MADIAGFGVLDFIACCAGAGVVYLAALGLPAAQTSLVTRKGGGA